MASWSALSFGGWAPFESFGDSWLGEYFNRRATDYAAETNLANSMALSSWSAQEMPRLLREGYEKAGYNPILLAGGSSSAASSPGSVAALSPSSSGGSSGHFGNPLAIAQARAAIAQSNSAKNAQDALADLYRANAKRLRFIPLNEQDTGGISFLGSGVNFGGVDTLLYDTETGMLVRPKSSKTPENLNSAGSLPAKESHEKNKDKAFRFWR